MPPSSSNENGRKEDRDEYDDSNNKSKSTPTSSWFGSWFERDMRDEIREKLNDFDERKKNHEAEQRERQRFFRQHNPSSFPFPFIPPEASDTKKESSNTDKDNTPAGFDSEKHEDDFEEFFGRIPRWQGRFFDDWNNEYSEDHRRHRDNPFGKKNNDNVNNSNVDDIHREMRSLFEAALSGGILPPRGSNGSNDNNHNQQHSGGGSWTSSSTTVVSNGNGTSYRMQQDSKNGARVDVQLPRSSKSQDVALEVVQERPCVIRWSNTSSSNNSSNDRDGDKNGSFGDARTHHHESLGQGRKQRKNGQVLELGDSVDCSRLSASISDAQNTLTIEAPLSGRNGDNAQPQKCPRSVPLSRRN